MIVSLDHFDFIISVSILSFTVLSFILNFITIYILSRPKFLKSRFLRDLRDLTDRDLVFYEILRDCFRDLSRIKIVLLHLVNDRKYLIKSIVKTKFVFGGISQR